MSLEVEYQKIISFWFHEESKKNWFVKKEAFDESIRKNFSDIYEKAAKGEVYTWRTQALGRLAEIIVLDQFPRNMYRDHAWAFATDAMALVLAQEAVGLKVDAQLKPEEKAFLYLPHMHSESLVIHKEAVKLFDQPGLEYNLKYEHLHLKVIERFGRYPHRNKILGRVSTLEEIEFLKTEGSSF